LFVVAEIFGHAFSAALRMIWMTLSST